MIEIVLGDIVEEATDAIVNSANSSLLSGSGLSSAIHSAAGRFLEMECIQIGPCPPREARITAGYNLKAKYVIHAVAPKYWDGTKGEADILKRTYKSIFEIARTNKVKRISIPAIGTGIYRFPLELAAEIAMASAFDNANNLDVRFVCFNNQQKMTYEKVMLLKSLNSN